MTPRKPAKPKSDTPHGIRTAAVLGAGVMGAGIAAHLANAGIPVLLLDIVPEGATDRNAISKGAIEKLKKSNPAALMHPSFAARITPGNLEDDLARLKNVDWIIEAVIEKPEVKQSLYRRLLPHLSAQAVVSSNTSTIPLAVLLEGLPLSFRKRFLITHFFNPPRYMRLLEVVTSPETSPEALATVTAVADERLGKTIVPCHDTPGFIANRIGTYWLHAAVVHAIKDGILVEEADALLGKPAGVPKTGIFGLLDLVGLDLMPHVLGSLSRALPAPDAFHALGPAPELMNKMIAAGLTGRKGQGGFYRLGTDKKKETIDLATGTYRATKKARLPALDAFKKDGLQALLMHPSPAGRYAWQVLSGTLAYAASLLGEIADDIPGIDAAMRLGYNWKFGPFELLDKLGPAWFASQLAAENRPIPPILHKVGGGTFYKTHGGRKLVFTQKADYLPLVRPQGVLLLEDIKRRSRPVWRNWSASVWDAGDGVAVLEFHSKMNSLNPLSLMMINKAVKRLPRSGFKALVIYNEDSNFSVGANILMLQLTGMVRAWPLINWILSAGQNALAGLKYAPFPVVAAPKGMVLGGGAEVVLHAHAVVAHAETYIGLVEAGVGIIPGWGGCTELLGRALSDPKRAGGPIPPIAKTFETIATAKVAKSAFEAKDLLFLREADEVVMNQDRLLAAAKAKALSMVKAHALPQPHSYPLPGPGGAAALKLALNDFVLKGMATVHDAVIGRTLARVLTGAETDVSLPPLTEDDLRKLEREGLVSLAKTQPTRDRISHMLKTGKPLRN